MERVEQAAAAGVLDSLPIAVVLVDERLRVTAWNEAACVLYGHAPADAIGRPLPDVLFEVDDRPSAGRMLADAVGGATWEGDCRVQRADGVLLVSSFRAVPRPGGASWIATDGMDQGLAEQERDVLLSAERVARDTAEDALGLVEAILASAPVGVAVFDLDLRYTRVNDAFATISGTPAAEHVGRRPDELVAFPPQVGADLRRVVTTGRTVRGRSTEFTVTSDGSQRHLTASAFPIRSAAGAIVGAGLTVVDVTEIRRAVAERAELLQVAESAQARLAVLATASTVLTTTMELGELLERLAQVLAPGAADWCVIELIDSSGTTEHVSVSHRDRTRAAQLAAFLRASPLESRASGAVAGVLRTGQAVLVRPEEVERVLETAAADRGDPALADEFSVRSSIIVPIEARGQRLGVLILSTDGDRVLDDDDLDLAVEVAHRASLAVSNARAFQNEHRIAESLQRALLPTSLPDLAELDVAVRYVAATDGASVGGDWYDVITFEGSPSIGLVVGDVVGHDLSATTSMGQVRTVLRASVIEDHVSPAAALTRVDRLFRPLGLPYATCILAIFDPADRTLRWSNAGHPPPLLVRERRGTYLEDGSGVMLGVTQGADTAEAVVELQAGDVVVLYTDGLVERRGESLEDGLGRLAVWVMDTGAGTADQMADQLLERLLPAAEARGDDVALLVLKVRGDDAAPNSQRLAFSGGLDSAATARGFTAGVLERAGFGGLVDTAVLLVSEVVTNAIRHGRPPYELIVTVEAEAVEFRVDDAETAVPRAAQLDPLGENGRGLVLLDALATGWGIDVRNGDGKSTWFRLAVDDD